MKPPMSASTRARTLANTLEAPLIAQYQLLSRPSEWRMPKGSSSPIATPERPTNTAVIKARTMKLWNRVAGTTTLVRPKQRTPTAGGTSSASSRALWSEAR